LLHWGSKIEQENPMDIKNLTSIQLYAACKYLNDDRAAHEKRRDPYGDSRWCLDPGKLQAALEHGITDTTEPVPTFTGADLDECPLCHSQAFNSLDDDEYECYDCGEIFVWVFNQGASYMRRSSS
jgi:hypothetical protein